MMTTVYLNQAQNMHSKALCARVARFTSNGNYSIQILLTRDKLKLMYGNLDLAFYYVSSNRFLMSMKSCRKFWLGIMFELELIFFSRRNNSELNPQRYGSLNSNKISIRMTSWWKEIVHAKIDSQSILKSFALRVCVKDLTKLSNVWPPAITFNRQQD